MQRRSIASAAFAVFAASGCRLLLPKSPTWRSSPSLARKSKMNGSRFPARQRLLHPRFVRFFRSSKSFEFQLKERRTVMKAIVLALLAAATVAGSALAFQNGTSNTTASTPAVNAGAECCCVPCPSPCPPECLVACCE